MISAALVSQEDAIEARVSGEGEQDLETQTVAVEWEEGRDVVRWAGDAKVGCG